MNPLAGTTAVVWMFFTTPEANRIHGEPEITTFPIFDREITLENSPGESCGCLRRRQPHAVVAGGLSLAILV
ncbi:MAG: hypothetical protein ABSH14_09590 [Verrucomicrobiia bacterium]